MSSLLPSLNPTAYVGITPTYPGQNWFRRRDPIITDFHGYTVGDRWINTLGLTAWTMVGRTTTSGTWVRVGGTILNIIQLTPDVGAPVIAIASNINVVGDGGRIQTSNPAPGTLQISDIGPEPISQITTDVGVVTPLLGNVNIVGDNTRFRTVAVLGTTVQIDPIGAAGFVWFNAPISQVMVENTGFIASGAGLITLTLPPVSAFGDVLAVQGIGAGGWTIAQGAGQRILFNAATITTPGIAGSVSSSDRCDALMMICVTANTDWVIYQVKGNLTYV